VGHKKYNGLELDERTGGWRVNGSVVRDGERTRLGEEAAERKESFFFRKTCVTARAFRRTRKIFPQRLKPRDFGPVAARPPFVPQDKKPCPDVNHRCHTDSKP
jgi:hypothetical protein